MESTHKESVYVYYTETGDDDIEICIENYKRVKLPITKIC